MAVPVTWVLRGLFIVSEADGVTGVKIHVTTTGVPPVTRVAGYNAGSKRVDPGIRDGLSRGTPTRTPVADVNGGVPP